MITVDFYNRTRERTSHKVFSDLAIRAHAALTKEKVIKKSDHFTVELTLVGNSFIQKLNAFYHKKDRPTDVISLSYFDEVESDGFVGEIFISIPYARAQAKKIGQSLQEELQFLFVHGLLHVFGYDHMKPADEKEMLRVAYKVLGRK